LVASVEVVLLTPHCHNLAEFFEEQIEGLLVECLDEFSRVGLSPLRLE
jgi:hypothetical protein